MTGFQGRTWAETIGLIVLALLALAVPLYILVAYVADAQAEEAIRDHAAQGPHKEVAQMRQGLADLAHQIDKLARRVDHIHELISKDLEHTRARLDQAEDRTTNITSRIRVLEHNVLERQEE